MTNIFDLRGPDFLVFYIAAAAAASVLTLIIQFLLRPPASPPAHPNFKLDPFETAFLTGGRKSVLEAAIVSLFQRGLVNASVTGRTITPVSDMPIPVLHAVEKYLLNRLPSAGDTVLKIRSYEFPDLVVSQSLLNNSLILQPFHASMLWLFKLLPLLSILAIGVTKICIGVSRNKPVAFLVLLSILTFILTIAFALRIPRRTLRGDRVLRQLRRKNSALQFTSKRRVVDLTPTDVALAAGLFGAASLAFGPLKEVAIAIKESHSYQSSGGSCGSGCGGGGCGGGGCGGGGCGGCSGG